jgi:lipopolysaccharide/colanic/teichoic acid biosynthesis glycosyltransferase
MITEQSNTGLGGTQGQSRLPRYEQPSFKFLKRTADIVFSLLGLILFFPLFVVLAVIVISADGGPIFFKQKRLGQNGRHFWMFKFRSMRKDAEKALKELLERDPEARREFEETYKLKNDPRLIRFGSLMRKTSLDELPQLLNVLLGDMSVVGPRPIVPPEAEKYGDDIDIYLKMKPGCAGLWQCSGRNDTTYAERIQFDKDYYWNASFRRDFVVLWRTIKSMLVGKGAY